MKRPEHGFDRNASHTEGEYVCDCGEEYCLTADNKWMDWAAGRIAELEAKLEHLEGKYHYALTDQIKKGREIKRLRRAVRAAQEMADDYERYEPRGDKYKDYPLHDVDILARWEAAVKALEDGE